MTLLKKNSVEFLTLFYLRERSCPQKNSVKQGSKRVTEYIIDFHTIAAESIWNEEALTDAFFQGLNSKIKDELDTKKYPKSLESLEDLATLVGLRLWER